MRIARSYLNDESKVYIPNVYDDYCIPGSSMIITTGAGPLLFGFSALGILGYLISGTLGLWLVWNIIRTKRY